MGKPVLNVGLIGTGFMGKTHTFGFAAASRVFDLPFEVVLHTVADRTEDLGRAAAQSLGFRHGTGDWRRLVADPEIHLVDVTTPNAFHKEMSLAGLAAGKHVYCEKPLAPLASEAREMADAADLSGTKTQVGFNYLCNPMIGLAREMIEAGELGEIRTFRGIHAEDYMTDAGHPYSFRNDPVGGGVAADLGSHILATAEHLMGPIAQVLGDAVTAIATRPDGKGGSLPVATDDVTRAFLRFENGATGSIEASWIANGRKMQHDFEIYGSKGGLIFSQERFNELHFYRSEDPAGRQGFRRIEAGPAHPPYGLFCVAPGHQLGFNDLKAIEVARYLDAIAGTAPEPFNFRKGLHIQELVETILRSSREARWLSPAA
ncbi:MAG: Gfo/Idh/MocA family oxidoreductase [Amaricoccus sp.]|uniref:Gfo/Idh/MocA family protein n=1 Tax=Amaricoccus sp. TaxID=1872485 RepID=UPI0039E2AD73